MDMLTKMEKQVFKLWLENHIIVLGILNAIWLTWQCYQNYLWIINGTSPLKPMDLFVLCFVIPAHLFIVCHVLIRFLAYKDNKVTLFYRYLFLLDTLYIIYRMPFDMNSTETMAMHHFISLINVGLLCGFNWACFYNCIRQIQNGKR